MIHFFRIRIRVLLYHLRMQQGFTHAQIRGALILFCLIIILFFFRCALRAFHEREENLSMEEKKQMDSLLLSAKVSSHRHQSSQRFVKKTYEPKTYMKTAKAPTASLRYDLNQADSIQLVSLRGIGPVLAIRILKYKKALGGFYRKEQLYEIWGLDSIAVNNILPNLYIADGYQPETIHLNTTDYVTLKSHPYISPPEASTIMRYKKQKGKFLSPSELEPLVAQYNQLKYYLSLD